MEEFILSLDKNKFYAIVNNDIYVPIEKKYELGYYLNYEFGLGFELTNYDLDNGDIEFMLLYRSLKFWKRPIELTHGINIVNFSPEKTYKKISEEELLSLADNLKLDDEFINNLNQKKKEAELKIINAKKEKELEEKKQHQLVIDKKLFEENINLINYDKYKTSLVLLQKHGGYGNKKQLLLTYDLIKDHFLNNYSFNGINDFNEVNFNASKQIINLFETLKIIYQDKNSGELEKALKNSNTVEHRISILNNHFTNTLIPSE